MKSIFEGREYMKDLSSTQFFQVESGPQIQAKDILEIVYRALVEKGYNPVTIPNREVKLTCADGTAMQCGRVGSRLLLSRASDFERFLRLFWSFYLLMMFFISR